jgi:hypothetical protein
MRAIVAKLIYGVVIAEVIIGMWLSFLTISVRSFQPSTRTWFDGLGRRLENPPFIARWIFGADSQWAGWGYLMLDAVVFWTLVATGYGLLIAADKIGRKPRV